MTAGGVTLSIGSGGTAAVIATPAAYAGVALTAHGTLGLINAVRLGFAKTYNPDNNANQKSDKPYREKTRGANKRDRKQLDDAARQHKIDRKKFKNYVHRKRKSIEKAGPSDNYSWSELQELAEDFKIEYGE